MLLLLASQALAAPSLPELLEADAGRGAEIALACTSTRGAAAQLGALGSRALSRSSKDTHLDEALALAVTLGTSDADAPLHVVAWSAKAGFLAEFGTSRTPEDIARLLAQGGPHPTQEGAAWLVPAASGSPARVEAMPGGVRVTNGRTPGATGTGMPPALRKSLPDTPGCAVYLRDENTRMGDTAIVLHLEELKGGGGPFALATQRMNLNVGVTASAMSALEGFTFTPTPPATVRTPQRPSWVAVLGVGFDGLHLEELVEEPQSQRALRRLRRALPVGPGTVVASFEQPETFAASVPLTKAWSPRKAARRLAKVARKLDARVTFLDATHLRIEKNTRRIHAAGTRGGLLLAGSSGTLLAMEQGSGEPWVQGAVAEAAGRYPFMLTSLGPENQRLTLAIDLRDQAISMRAELPSMLTLVQLLQRNDEPETPSDAPPAP